MVRQSFDLLGQPVSIAPFDGLDNLGMQPPPPLLEEAAVGHLVGEGMFESVLRLREEPCLVEELSRLEVCQATV
jgi:hypothetical protein